MTPDLEIDGTEDGKEVGLGDAGVGDRGHEGRQMRR